VPHLIIEFSENLEAVIDIAGLASAMHDTAVTLDALPTGGIRTRAVARRIFKVADGHADNGFVSVTVRMAKGRTQDVQKAVGEALFATLSNYVREAFDRRWPSKSRKSIRKCAGSKVIFVTIWRIDTAPVEYDDEPLLPAKIPLRPE
jgi:5-carboxymethyl-2-hydroxymuconate isomerase